MRVKTFRGDNAKAVLAQIKKELGTDAVILSNLSKRENGRTVCEIMAAVEEDLAKTTKARAPEPALPGPATEPGPQWAQEWTEIKKHLQAYLKPHMDLDSLPASQRMALEYLEREGVDQSLLMGLYQELKAHRNGSLLAELGKLVRVRPFDDNWPERLQLVVGPHGAGKTTSLIRMALACKRANREQRICLVNSDSRSNGRKQLKHYAELSGLSYMEADGPEEFALLLAQCRNFDKIFVDLPGLCREETFQGWLSERGLAGYENMAAHLVLSPLYSVEQFKAFWQRFQAPCVKSLIWTKLDEACSYGGLINVGAMTGLPASALGHGPGITNSMAAAESKALWKLIFTRHLPGARTAVELAA